MTTPYRNDLDALEERKESLERELAELKRQTHLLEGLRAQQEKLEDELASVSRKVGAKSRARALPMLENVRVASPCNASWDAMVGDDRVRFCKSCEKNVYNLSAMAPAEAEQLLQARAGKEMCVRFYQRADGTVMTEDCPIGVKKKRRKKLAFALAGAGALAAAATSVMSSTTMGKRAPMMGAVAMGEMTVDPTPVSPPPVNPPAPAGRMGKPAR